MSRHVTYRGVTVDMEAMVRENEKSVAVGNMKVNAKGDQLGKGSQVTRTADQIARDNHRVQAAVIKTGLKGKQPIAEDITFEKPKNSKEPKKSQTSSAVKEKELPSGDIIIEDSKE